MLKASAKRVWTFEDVGVTAQSFPPASMEQYNSVLGEMLEHVAMVAQISPAQVTGKLINVSAEALGGGRGQPAAETTIASGTVSVSRGSRRSGSQPRSTATPQPHLMSRRKSFGVTPKRERSAPLWTGSRSWLPPVCPIAELLELIPNLTQQKIQAIKDGLRQGQVNQLLAALRPAPPQPQGPPPNGQPPRIAEGVNAVPG